ncbi:esterase-like activity of phytase family protein [Nonomuraea sp. CA-143628]|uniref:esterase-like activity of phytase family protein n=1 Tax=Nonomuraea sp. CA-143628 TaxID=3239997 RepID=UPI003D90AF9B
MRRIVGIAATVAVTIGLAAVPAATVASASPQPVEITRFLGEQRLPFKMSYAGTTVGGLSGLDRDPLTGTWYLISDDRGRYGPARFYTGRLAFDWRTGAFTGVHLTGVNTFLRPDGSTYPPYGEPGSADPETIRYDRWTDRLLWGDEGDRPDAGHPDISPSGLYVHRADAQGQQVGELPMPANLLMTTTGSGPRRNFGIEGLALTPRMKLYEIDSQPIPSDLQAPGYRTSTRPGRQYRTWRASSVPCVYLGKADISVASSHAGRGREAIRWKPKPRPSGKPGGPWLENRVVGA